MIVKLECFRAEHWDLFRAEPDQGTVGALPPLEGAAKKRRKKNQTYLFPPTFFFNNFYNSSYFEISNEQKPITLHSTVDRDNCFRCKMKDDAINKSISFLSMKFGLEVDGGTKGAKLFFTLAPNRSGKALDLFHMCIWHCANGQQTKKLTQRPYKKKERERGERETELFITFKDVEFLLGQWNNLIMTWRFLLECETTLLLIQRQC